MFCHWSGFHCQRKQSVGSSMRRTVYKLFAGCAMNGIVGLVGKVGAGGLALLAAELNAEPTMEVTDGGTNGIIDYFVVNSSPPGDGYNMTEFRIPAGSNQGVYDTFSYLFWDATIWPDYTEFVHGSEPTMVPGQSNLFTVYSNVMTTGRGDAEAESLDFGHFTPVEVDVPANFYTLTHDVTNSLWGEVQMNPEPNDPNSSQWQEGTVVTLTAIPNEGRSFSRWEIYDDANFAGDANYAVLDSNLVTQVRMDHDKHVTAVFKCGGASMALFPFLCLTLLCLFAFQRRSSGLAR